MNYPVAAPVESVLGDAGGAPFNYVGGELDLFAAAVNWKCYFASRLLPFIGRDVLEVGAGLGSTTRVLCDGRQARWVCLEPDSALAARASAPGLLPGCCTVRVGTVADFPATPTFDTILYVDVLEHIEQDGAELARAAERLAPGGHVVTLSPAHQWLFSPFDRQIGHFRRYTKRSLRAITPAGLSMVKACYLDSVGLLASLANACLLRQSVPDRRQIALWDRVMVPISRRVDWLIGYSCGKSVVGVWRKG